MSGFTSIHIPADAIPTIREAAKHLRRSPEADGIGTDRLRSIVERIERLEEERKGLGQDIADIFKEAVSAGFDKKALKRLITTRKQEAAEVEEQETLLDIYRKALG